MITAKGITATGLLAKAAGIAGLALVGYDSHYAGKMIASKNTEETKTDTLEGQYFNNMKTNTSSVVEAGIKKRIFKYHLDENFSGFFSGIGGYAKGFGSMLVDNVIPLGLSAGALLTKGALSKMFGLGLVAYGGIFLAQEIFGIGKSK